MVQKSGKLTSWGKGSFIAYPRWFELPGFLVAIFPLRLGWPNLKVSLGVKSLVFIRMILLGKLPRLSWFAICPPGAEAEKGDFFGNTHGNSSGKTLETYIQIVAIGSCNFRSLRNLKQLYQLSTYVPQWSAKLRKLPISLRCTLQELSTYLRSLVPDAEMRIDLPCALSGRNRGYAFVKLNEGLPLLVRALWNIPTRKTTRILKLQLAKANVAFCQSLSVWMQGSGFSFWFALTMCSMVVSAPIFAHSQ